MSKDTGLKGFFAEEGVSSILNAIPDTIIVVDTVGDVVWANESISLLGYSPADIIGSAVEMLIPEEARDNHANHRRVFGKQPSRRFFVDNPHLTALTKSGELMDVVIELTPVTIAQTPCVVAVMRENNSALFLKKSLAQVEMLLNESQSIARLGSWNWDIVGEKLDWSDQIYTIFGISPQDFRASYEAFLEMVHPDDRAEVDAAVNNSLTSGFPYHITHRVVRPDGEIRYVTERARVYRDIHQAPIRMIGTVQDVTEEHKKSSELLDAYATIQSHQSELEYLAYFDALTNLPNRNHLIKYIDDLIHKAESGIEHFAFICMDLDGFKEINDFAGHGEGDVVLREVAEKLLKLAPHNALIARLGGDEFGIVVHTSQEGDSERLAKAIISSINFSKVIGGIDFKITASAGVAFYPEQGEDAFELLKKADIAMYQAKSAGKNQYHFFDSDINERREKRIKLLSDLEKATREKQFEVYFQPKIEVASSNTLHAEALVRWHHPEQGYITPDEFIPLAEESGLIIAIGELVLRDVCAFIKQCNNKLDLCVAVNLSVKQLYQPNVVESFCEIIREYGISPQELEFEITESAVMGNVEVAKKVLLQFRGIGSSIALDDFGTGYSSLSYLANLPIDVVKIDRMFIRDMSPDRDESSICRAIISLAHSLNKHVVAEGVETPEQMATLRQLGCDVMQGYLFSKPLPGKKFLEFIGGYDWRAEL